MDKQQKQSCLRIIDGKRKNKHNAKIQLACPNPSPKARTEMPHDDGDNVPLLDKVFICLNAPLSFSIHLLVK